MTTIHFSTTGELLHILDDYPEVLAELRRKLLTDDLLAMPESVRAIRETQREMQETQRRIADLLNQTAERLDALEARQEQYDARLVRIEASQERMEARQDQSDARLERIEIQQDQSDARLTRIEASQERMEARQDQSDARLTRIEASQERMEARQDQSDARLTRMEATQAEMLQWQANADVRFDRIESQQAETLQWQAKADTRFDRIEGRLGNLRGKDLEQQAINDFEHVAIHEFGVVRTGMIQVAALHLRIDPSQPVESYKASIAAACDNGLITYEEETELRRADFVARGYSRQDMSPVWFVAEVSGTIAFDDIRRAHERADILSRALSETVIPVAYGLRVSDRLRVVAETRGVRIAMRPQPDENYT